MRVAAAILGLGVVLLAASPALADFGAVAWDKATGKRGWSIHEPSQKRADEAALSACGASGCKVVIRIRPGRCGAVAGVAGKPLIGAAARENRDAARLKALSDCRKGTSADCVVQFSDCNH